MYIQLTKNITFSLNDDENPSIRRCYFQIFREKRGNHSHAKKRVVKFVPKQNRYIYKLTRTQS